MIVPSIKYNISEVSLNSYSYVSTLHMRSIDVQDFAEYECVSKNTIGKSEETIELYEIVRDVQTQAPLAENTYMYYEEVSKKVDDDLEAKGGRGHGRRRERKKNDRRRNGDLKKDASDQPYGYENNGFFGTKSATDRILGNVLLISALMIGF